MRVSLLSVSAQTAIPVLMVEFATIGAKGHEVEGVLNRGDARLRMQLKNGTIRLKIAP